MGAAGVVAVGAAGVVAVDAAGVVAVGAAGAAVFAVRANRRAFKLFMAAGAPPAKRGSMESLGELPYSSSLFSTVISVIFILVS